MRACLKIKNLGGNLSRQYSDVGNKGLNIPSLPHFKIAKVNNYAKSFLLSSEGNEGLHIPY